MKKYCFYVLLFGTFISAAPRAAVGGGPWRSSTKASNAEAATAEAAAREKYKQLVVAFFRDPDAVFEALEQKNRELTPEQRRARLRAMAKARNKNG